MNTSPSASADDPYAKIAALYDLEHQHFTDDIPFYRMLAGASDGGPVLELACGTGRLLVPLAEHGYRVVGADRSPAMLGRARQAIDDAGVGSSVSLAAATIEDADRISGGPFDLVILALNAFMHLTDSEQQRRALIAARHALAPGGQLAIDVINPTPATLQGFDGSVIHEGTWKDDTAQRVDKFSSRSMYAATQESATELWYDTVAADGMVRRIATAFPMRFVYPSELELMLEFAGFGEWRVFGGYELDPLTDESDRLIAIALAPQ